MLKGAKKPRPTEPGPQRAGEDFDTPPVELEGDDIARAEWTRVAPILRNCGLMSDSDKTSLLALCQQWSLYLQAQKEVRRLGMIVKKPSGIPIVNPYLGISMAALNQCRNLWHELGITPSGRAHLSALPALEPDEKENKWAGLLT